MTYTTVHKAYQAPTFEAAVAEMMRDPDIFHQRHGSNEEARYEAGDQKGYSVESWEWNATAHELTVNFR